MEVNNSRWNLASLRAAFQFTFAAFSGDQSIRPIHRYASNPVSGFSRLSCGCTVFLVAAFLSFSSVDVSVGQSNQIIHPQSIKIPGRGTSNKSNGRIDVAMRSASSTLKKPATEARRPVGAFQNGWYVTPNFQVRANNARLAQEVGERAEVYREELAQRWLGRSLPDWKGRCPIQVVVNGRAQGETSFLLPSTGTGMPTEWDMKIFGPPNRILDSVLPHEITHTVFATYFGRRLPRWADEGACTTVEHPAEKKKIQSMLLRFLSPSQRKGIPFNHMFQMREYPSEMLPLYAQGYSVARFLIAQGGHQQFVRFLGTGMNNEGAMGTLPAWNNAVQRFYGYEDLSDLQIQWLRWVQKGSDESVAINFSNRKKTSEGQAIARNSGSPNNAQNHLASNQTIQNGLAGDSKNNFYVKKMNQTKSAGTLFATPKLIPTNTQGKAVPLGQNLTGGQTIAGSSAKNSLTQIPGRSKSASQMGETSKVSKSFGNSSRFASKPTKGSPSSTSNHRRDSTIVRQR